MSQNRLRSVNRLIASLSETEYQRLEPYLTPIRLPLHTVLYEADEKIENVYFPQTALIALVSTLENGSTSEISLIGSTGMIGLPVILASGRSNHRAIVQVANYGIKISARILKREFDRGGELQRILLRYTETRLNEVAQLAVCNAHHTIEQRLARCLLIVRDSIQSNELLLTQELISNMLGVRRAGVTIGAQTFQRAGLISYRRGRIKILQQKALENVACECYQLYRENYRQ